MLKLILMRHAKSSWDSFSLPDFERPLNNRGIGNAEEMGEYLNEKGIKVEKTVCSPAFRTKQTLELLGKNLKTGQIVFEKDIYEASLNILIGIISRQESASPLMLIGHNPGISQVSEHLSGELFGTLPTAAVIILEFDADNWDEIKTKKGKLKKKIFPKEL